MAVNLSFNFSSIKFEHLNLSTYITRHQYISVFCTKYLPTVCESHGRSPGELSEELVTQEKRNKGWRMSCDVGEATEGFENEL